MVSFNLTIVDERGSLTIGPFSSDTWPCQGNVLKMDLTFEKNGPRHMDGPRFDVLDRIADDNEVVIKRHVG